MSIPLLMLAGDIGRNPGPNEESATVWTIEQWGETNFSVDTDEESLSMNFNVANGILDFSINLAGNFGLEQDNHKNIAGRENPSYNMDNASNY